MSDPLSLTASLISVLQLVRTVTNLARDVRHAPAEKSHLRDEVRSTACLVEMIKDRVDDSGGDDENSLRPASLSSLASPDGPLEQFKKLLEGVVDKLTGRGGGRLRQLGQAMKWPFDRDETKGLLDALERVKSHFMLVLQNDILELTRLSNLKLDDIDNKVEDSAARSRSEERDKIINWLCPFSFYSTHQDILSDVEPGTGMWFLQHDLYQDWKSGSFDMLWCPGIPGSGKTRIASLVIDDLQRTLGANSALTFIYCDYHQRKLQAPSALLSSLLQQILHAYAQDILPSPVVMLYKSHHKYGTRPTLPQQIELLQKLFSAAPSARIFLVLDALDALDECGESESQALEFVSSLRDLMGVSISILCTGRHSGVFDEYFAGCPRLEISAQDEDVRTYLDAQIPKQDRLARHVRSDPSLRADISDKIIAESRGMFLLARLHLESLSQKISRGDVRRALQVLPATLDATYSEALARLRTQAPEAANLALSVLFWAVCAARPLSVPELQHIYAARDLPAGSSLEEDDLPDSDILTSICGGLLVVDRDAKVEMVHYTAVQYFQRSDGQELLNAKRDMTLACLSYLTLLDFPGPCPDDKSMKKRVETRPFLYYAAKYWGKEVETYQKEDEKVSRRLDAFLQSQTAIAVATQASSVPKVHYHSWSQEYPREVPALVLVARFPLPDLIRNMVSQGHNLEGKGTDEETALLRAASAGCLPSVMTLLDLGADASATDHAGETALHKAARLGSSPMMSMLISRQSAGTISSTTSSHWTVLMSAVASGSIDTVRVLLDAPAVVDLAAETVWGDSALSLATRAGHEEIALLLADRGAVLPRGPAGRRASLVASRRGLVKLVRRLTADYEAVAGKPLQRQSSRIMGGLSEIQEGAEDHAGKSGEVSDGSADESSGVNEGDVMDLVEQMGCRVGGAERYIRQDLLGKGHFAEVWRSTSRVTGVQYAVKVFKLRDLRRYGQQLASSPLEMVVGEVKAMREIAGGNHPSVVRLVDLFVEYEYGYIGMVQELVAEGELFELIVARGKLTEEESRKIFLQLLSALEQMHREGWVHRDIKPENILVADAQDLTIKIADFGIAKKLGTSTDTASPELTSTLCGTTSYAAPEVIQPASLRKYGCPVDIWSSGVVLYICLCGFPPFSDELYHESDYPFTLSQQIMAGRFEYPSPYWDSVGDPALDFVDSMLIPDDARRFTATACLEHAWMRNQGLPLVLGGMERSSSPDVIHDEPGSMNETGD